MKLSSIVKGALHLFGYGREKSILDTSRPIENPSENPHSSAAESSTLNTPSDQAYVNAWRENQSIAAGMRFVATMQLRTPLRVLERHGELHTDISSAPPVITQEGWEGVWTIQTKTFRELGIDLPEFRKSEDDMATDIGPFPDGIAPYHEFLCAVRKCVEAEESISDRVKNLRLLLASSQYKGFVRKHGGEEQIVDRFFPFFLDTVPSLPATAAEELREKKLSTPLQISQTTDEALLDIKGIGPAKLKTLREYCRSIGPDSTEERLDRVKR